MLSLLVISLTLLAHLTAGAPAPEPDLISFPLLPPNATGPLAPVISRKCIPPCTESRSLDISCNHVLKNPLSR